MYPARIVGTGLYHPENLVTNQFFDEKYGKNISDFLVSRRNIKQRYFMADGHATSDLAVPAARAALARAGLEPKALNLIIVATDTPDQLSPATAAVVQHRLGATRAAAFDLNSACAGFVTALDVAAKFFKADEHYEHILVVGAYGMSKFLDWDDYKIASMFADGAGAVVLSRVSSGPRILATALYADGQYYDHMGVYGGGTLCPSSVASVQAKKHLLSFAKKIPIETNLVHWPRLTRELLTRAGRELKEVKKFFLTQLNIETIEAVMKALELPSSSSFNVMDRFGYTGSACIPMAMAVADEEQALENGDLVVLLGSGGGLSMAALLMEWGSAR